MTEICPECVRKDALIRMALALIARFPGGMVAEVKKVLERAL